MPLQAKQTGRLPDRQAEQAGRLPASQAGRQADSQAGRQAGRLAGGPGTWKCLLGVNTSIIRPIATSVYVTSNAKRHTEIAECRSRGKVYKVSVL